MVPHNARDGVGSNPNEMTNPSDSEEQEEKLITLCNTVMHHNPRAGVGSGCNPNTSFGSVLKPYQMHNSITPPLVPVTA
ncbi:hypothetical protein IC220_03355 [Wolbachia endosymbiont of Pentalonia nigronervosa]|uniref:hypothetical protein n=1 Tax=Wolbachia endosymbiont of Pentalonia nigronervosa TaxID=1301914 RepID=UPI00165FA0CC|nr:hypothetical protein [Wolbachia endosymbiont of Pentalonia nigronervosa]MBD0391495.1 hypothetical protein [Wolbachia endosymbiont of Pentalonia nigronervosa]